MHSYITRQVQYTSMPKKVYKFSADVECRGEILYNSDKMDKEECNSSRDNKINYKIAVKVQVK